VPLSHSKTDPRGAKKGKRQSNRAKGGKPQGGKPGGRPPRGGGGKPRKELPYFLQPVTGGIGVFRRPVGNRAEATTCGVMPNRKQADALVEQLKRAESVVSDLFLEATEDGILALETVLAACRDAVLRQAEPRPGRGGSRQARPQATGEGGAGGEAANGGERGGGGRKPRRGRGRRRSGPRREGGEGGEAGGAGGEGAAP
jgi:hypothetical protein